MSSEPNHPHRPASVIEARFEPPRAEDGREMWRIARDSGSLDLNSPYSYALWCRDFAATSVVARCAGVCGFVTGYIRPDEPGTLFVWQVAVDAAWRGRGLAGRMLAHVADRLPDGSGYLEATVTPANTASDRLFTAFARDRNADLRRRQLFGTEVLPGEHEPEILYRIGPLGT